MKHSKAVWIAFSIVLVVVAICLGRQLARASEDDQLGDSKPVAHSEFWKDPVKVPPSEKTVYVISKVPGVWSVASAVRKIDPYTGSRWVMSKTCPKKAYRCITVKPGNLAAPRLAETRNYLGSRVTILVDMPYANKRANTTAKKKWVMAHELGHAAGLRSHVGSCGNLMHKSIGCWKYGVTSSQKAVMARR